MAKMLNIADLRHGLKICCMSEHVGCVPQGWITRVQETEKGGEFYIHCRKGRHFLPPAIAESNGNIPEFTIVGEL